MRFPWSISPEGKAGSKYFSGDFAIPQNCYEDHKYRWIEKSIAMW